ncbi:MAG: RluA family pseudouridine synthase [Hyphomonadaceae bacterium]|nr:RluA family pseudouridine synthase [Hyphomonadaceae bacterium]
MKKVEQIEVGADEGEVRLDRWLKRRARALTQGQIEKMLRTGQVRVDGARAKANDRLRAGQIVRIPPLPEERAPGGLSERDAAFAQSLVIHRDDDVIVLNKPAGLATQGGAKTLRHIDALLPALKFEKEEKPKLIHRLDRDTSGCLVLARHPRAAAALAKSFRTREAQKIYWAIVLGTPQPAAGQIRGWMHKAPGSAGREADREMMRRCKQNDEGAVFAVTDYVTLQRAGGKASWVAMKPETGRTHQLRFHMAEIGNSILGDGKYTCDRPTPAGLANQLHLHARAIRLPHPTKGVLQASAELPGHMKETMKALGFDPREAKDPFEAFA